MRICEKGSFKKAICFLCTLWAFFLWNKEVISAHPLSLSHFKRLRVLRDSIGRRIKWRCISLFQKERSTFLSHKSLLMGTRTPDIDILLMVHWFKGVHEETKALYGEHCYERVGESMKCELEVFLGHTESVQFLKMFLFWFFLHPKCSWFSFLRPFNFGLHYSCKLATFYTFYTLNGHDFVYMTIFALSLLRIKHLGCFMKFIVKIK